MAGADVRPGSLDGAGVQVTEDERARAEQARRLGAIRRRAFLATVVLELAYPGGLWLSGAWERGWGAALALGLPLWWTAALAVGAYGLGQATLLLPARYYVGFVVARRLGLSRQTASGWLADWAKATLIGLLLALAAGLLFFWSVARLGPHWWWLYGLALAGGGALLSFAMPYVLVPLFFRMRPLEDEQLVARVQALVARAGVEVRAVCSLDFSRKTAEANAAVIGLGRSRRIVLADTLLESFSPREVDSVLAHELGHHVHRDVLRSLAVSALVVLAGLLLAHWLLLPHLGRSYGLDLMRLPAALPVLAGLAQLYLLLLLPATNAISRAFEAAADQFALRLTGDPQAFASALRKLASQNLVEEQPPQWAEVLLHTHPSIARRIAAAERWREATGGA